MILETIHLRHVGRFRDAVEVGPLDPGLNVLASPNEQGKTTVVRAAIRCLFDKPGTRGEEMRALQPVGTDLDPEVTVQFVHQGRRHRLFKRFGARAACRLEAEEDGVWRLLAEEDAAHRRVLEMLGAGAPGRGASKPEHWGLVRYLWARQGEPVLWPDWQDAAGEAIRRRLARVELDPTVDRVRAGLEALAAGTFTRTGRLRTGGEAHALETRIGELRARLQELQDRLARIESVEARHRQLALELDQAARERDQHQAEAERLQQALHELEVQRERIETARHQFEQANAALQEIEADRRRLEACRAEIARLDEALKDHRQRLEQTRQRLEAARRQLARAEEERAFHQTQARQAETRVRRWQTLREWRRRLQETARLRRLVERIESLAARKRDLHQRRARLPQLTADDVERLDALEREIAGLEAQMRAAGLEVRLTPDQPGTIDVEDETGPRTEEIGPGSVLHARSRLKLTLPSWGALEIRSGAREAEQLAARLDERRHELAGLREELGVASAAQAAQVREQAGLLDQELDALQRQLGEWLEEFTDEDALRAALGQAEAAAERLAQELDPIAPDEESLPLPAIEAALENARTQETAARRLAEQAESDLAAAQQEVASLRDQLAAHEQETARLQAAHEHQQTRLRELEAKHPDGLDAALRAAREAFVQAEARLNVARSKLPPEADLLPERHHRAVRAAAGAAARWQQLRDERQRLEGALGQEAAAGLHSRIVELEETLADLEDRQRRLLARARAARLLASLIQLRSRRQVETMLRPLEDELSAIFAELTGEPGRRVFLDQDLRLEGVGRDRATACPFGWLSQGAREQLLLALRAAVARHLSETDRQLLILDDVLVNTDPVRQVRVLDFLTQLARDVQILVLTCHPERYAGAGHPLRLES
ncbi:MAG: hypothetical protein D6766_03835 [Verrucomicrobia bacterium]|nr:MAG: hypothetical protein D6766_03835 [Verrucomicrobiota bacterium]